jgi:hypothetical protein
VIYNAITAYFESHSASQIEQVLLVLYDQPTVDTFLEIWDQQART